MKKTLTHWLLASGLAAAALPLASPAMAQAAACIYRPGLLALLTPTHPALCSYQGDYIAQQGPIYDGPAIVAPQPTYSPSRTLPGYAHRPYRVASERVVRRAPVSRVKRVSVKNELPAGDGKAEIVHARAEVRIYGKERMEIRLFRH